MLVLSWVVSNVILALVLALAAWFAQRLARPGVAHVLWVLVLVKLVTPPLVSVPLGESRGLTDCERGICGCDQHTLPASFLHDTLPGMLLAIWAFGAGIAAWVAWHRWVCFRRMMTLAQPAPAEWQSLSARLASELSMRCPPEVLVVPGRLPPLVLAGRRCPRLLLPTELLDELNAPQRVALLLHELTHLQRGDHLVRMLELAVRVVYWWLPGVGWTGRQMRACEEVCCDAAVLNQLPEARRDYAKLLLDVIDFATLPQAQATAMSVANDLEQRLRAILDTTPRTRRPRLAGIFTVALACVILPCQLHYDIARPQPIRHEPKVEATPSPSSDGEPKWVKFSACCPS